MLIETVIRIMICNEELFLRNKLQEQFNATFYIQKDLVKTVYSCLSGNVYTC